MKPGVIRKITIKNFVTYADVEMYPGPNLNVVIGPNGTGKSTVVAAIILGLGGTPKTIGRGTKVSEYVRHECNEAKIDIDLYGEEENVTYTVTRVFNISNHSQWYINNKRVTEPDVLELTNQLNIQVSNLCQFLPQDRVQDFAKMDKKQLLINTQKAVGRQDLVEIHENLIKIREEQKQFIKDSESLNAKLEQAEAENSRLEGKVQNLNEKKKYIAEIESIKRKVSWVNYEKLEKEKEIVEIDRKKASDVLNKYKKKIQPVENKISELKTLSTVLQNRLLQARNNVRELKARVDANLDKTDEVENSQSRVLNEMKSNLEALNQRQNEIDTMKAKIDKLANDVNSLIEQYGTESEIDEQSNQLLEKTNIYRDRVDDENRMRVAAMNVQRDTIDQIRVLENSLREMENVKSQRLEKLRRRDQDAYQAVMWLKDNRNIFRGHVYDPMMLELNVIEKCHAKYIENIIPWRDRVAFTCEYREDMNLLLERVRDEQQLTINVVHSSSGSEVATHLPAVPIEQLRHLGFFAYANSLITGPQPILSYLCRQYSLQNIPVGDQSVYNNAPQVPASIRVFFSEKHRFAVNTSKYTGEKSTRISDVESDSSFSICIDYNSLNRVKKELDVKKDKERKIAANLEAIEAKRKAFDDKRHKLLDDRRTILKNKEQIIAARERLENSRRKLQSFMRDHRTSESIKQEAIDKMKKVVLNSLKTHNQILEAFTEYDQQAQDEELLNLERSTIIEQIAHMENEVSDLRNDYNEAQRFHENIDRLYQSAVKEVDDAMRAAKKLSNGYGPKDRGFEQFREKHESLPNNLDELNNLKNEVQTKVECLLTADDGELEAYEKGLKIIDNCREALNTKESKMTAMYEKLSSLYEQWITPLTDLIEQINKKFSSYFESMGCAGELSISKDNGDHEYSDYGLCIRVTYRKEQPLQELNRYTQSGGERAVATAVYMLAMQEASAAPFRCVDEINQGMDPHNERRIFDILVQATDRPDTCQYFLITPKLIHGLNFGNNVKVSIVHNGPFCETGKSIKLQTFIHARRAIME